MNKKIKNEAEKTGISEHVIILMEEYEKFIEENEDVFNNEIENEEQLERVLIVGEKLQFYREQIAMERKKFTEDIRQLKKRIIEKQHLELN